MTVNETRKLLDSVKDLDEKVNSIIDSLEFYNEKSKKITATYKSICVQEGGTSDTVAECAANIVDLQHALSEVWDEYTNRRDYIEALVNELSNPEQRYLLKSKYLHYKKWTDIQESMSDFFEKEYSEAYIRGKLHSECLKNLAKSIQKCKNDTKDIKR